MAYRKVKSKKFKLKKDAVDWAKKEKGKGQKLKWETNRIKDPNRPWEAVIFKDIK